MVRGPPTRLCICMDCRKINPYGARMSPRDYLRHQKEIVRKVREHCSSAARRDRTSPTEARPSAPVKTEESMATTDTAAMSGANRSPAPTRPAMTDVTNTVCEAEAPQPSTEEADLAADVSSLRSQLGLLQDQMKDRAHTSSALQARQDRLERSFQQLQQRHDDLNQRHQDLREEVEDRHTAYEAFREEVEDRLTACEAFREEFETRLGREQEEPAVRTKRAKVSEDPVVEERKKQLHSHFHLYMKQKMGVGPKGRVPDLHTRRPSDREVVRVDWDKPYDCAENLRLMQSAISELELLDQAADDGQDFASLARALGRPVTDSVCLSWFQKRKYERNYHARLSKPQQDLDASVRRRNARKERKLRDRLTALRTPQGHQVRETYPEADELKVELLSDEESDGEGRIFKKVQAWRSLRAERMIAALDALARDLHNGKPGVRRRRSRPQTRDTYLRVENGVPQPVPGLILKAHVSQDFANQYPGAVQQVQSGADPSWRNRWGEGFDSTKHHVEVSHPAPSCSES